MNAEDRIISVTEFERKVLFGVVTLAINDLPESQNKDEQLILATLKALQERLG